METTTLEAWAKANAAPELSEILTALGHAAAQIAAKIRLAGLEDVYGAAGATNVQGEQQQKLDVFANNIVTDALKACEAVRGLVSEEDEEPVRFATRSQNGKPGYAVSFDPLDGSSNIDVNVNVGTIFGVRRVAENSSVDACVLEPGSAQVAAGYVVYGPSVVYVLALQGNTGVQAFTLDGHGTFAHTGRDLRMPLQGPYYSANEANASSWPAAYREFLAALLSGKLGGTAYSARYIGSLVADFHRTLLKGGVFLYPPTAKAPQGKLRLQYEANPLALVCEAAGGAATEGVERILDLRGDGPHDRTPLVVGSRNEVELLRRMLAEGR